MHNQVCKKDEGKNQQVNLQTRTRGGGKSGGVKKQQQQQKTRLYSATSPCAEGEKHKKKND